MKKHYLLFAAASLLFVGSCGSSLDDKSNFNSTDAKISGSESSVAESFVAESEVSETSDSESTAGVNEVQGTKMLTRKDFLAKVMNYEKNPTEWVFEGNKPCLIDFYADWCAPCKQMDRTTFRNDNVAEHAKEFTMIKVNCTSPTPAVRKFMEQFKVVGMPTFVFIDSTGMELDQLREVGYINPEKFIDKLKITKGQE